MPKRITKEKQKRQGTARHDRVKPSITAEPISPEPDAGLDSIGRAEWTRITQALATSGRITALDQTVLSLYCSAFSRWKRSEQQLFEEGEVLWLEIRDTHGKVTHKKPVTNPLSKVAESAARACHRYGDALGLSPASRIKQGFEHSDAEENEGESILEWAQRQKEEKK